MSSVNRSTSPCFLAAARWKRFTMPQPRSSISRSSEVFPIVVKRSLQIAVTVCSSASVGGGAMPLRSSARGSRCPSSSAASAAASDVDMIASLSVCAGGLSAGCASSGRSHKRGWHRGAAEGNSRTRGGAGSRGTRQLGPPFAGCQRLAGAHMRHPLAGRCRHGPASLCPQTLPSMRNGGISNSAAARCDSTAA